MRSLRTCNRGQNLVEFAMVVLVLLVLVLGLADFGRAWMTRNIMTGAAREGVRIAAVRSGSSGGDNTWRDRAVEVLVSGNITGVEPLLVDDGVPFGTVRVQIDYEFPFIVTKLIPGLDNSITLTTQTSMRKEY